jgi:hypothetical protein
MLVVEGDGGTRFGKARQQRPEDDVSLEARQRRSETEVDAVAEGDVMVVGVVRRRAGPVR